MTFNELIIMTLMSVQHFDICLTFKCMNYHKQQISELLSIVEKQEPNQWYYTHRNIAISINSLESY